jgi:hypothetical protein
VRIRTRAASPRRTPCWPAEARQTRDLPMGHDGQRPVHSTFCSSAREGSRRPQPPGPQFADRLASNRSAIAPPKIFKEMPAISMTMPAVDLKVVAEEANRTPTTSRMFGSIQQSSGRIRIPFVVYSTSTAIRQEGLALETEPTVSLPWSRCTRASVGLSSSKVGPPLQSRACVRSGTRFTPNSHILSMSAGSIA